MRKIATALAAAAIVVGGAAAGSFISNPAVAVAQEAQTDDTTEDSRFTTLEEILGGLVTEGVITQDQADAVAEAISERAPRGFRGHRHGGHHLETVAEVLGMEPAELRDALQEGDTIADVATDNGVDVQDVIDAIVADHQERIDQAVADGNLTEEEAAEKLAEAAERAEAMVNGEFEGRRGFGRRGFGGPFGQNGDADAAETGRTF